MSPLVVAERVVDRSVRIALPPPTENEREASIRLQCSDARLDPAGLHLAIAIHELEEGGRIARIGKENGGTGIAGPRRREVGRHRQFDDTHTDAPRKVLTAVGRAGIDIDNMSGFSDGSQAGLQPIALVAADHDDAH
jgi:hypothetical protein